MKTFSFFPINPFLLELESPTDREKTVGSICYLNLSRPSVPIVKLEGTGGEGGQQGSFISRLFILRRTFVSV